MFSLAELTYLNLYTTDPAFNLAAEQYVFDSMPKDRMYFMLWQNDNAIIIGKYQNTLAEINLPYVEEHGIRVVRRLSGGGAVYHDMGNLNFTFIADAGDTEKLNMKVFCEPIAEALERIGVHAEINGRNDITIDGKKFSGNSQYLRGGRVMHHGTIMFDSDLSVLGEALKVDRSKIEAKGIKSIRSRVTNIKQHISDDISLEQFRELLLSGILEKFEGAEYVFSEKDVAEIERIRADRYSTWEWNFGRSPECTIKRIARIEGCGKIEAYITLEHGAVVSVEFRGDFFSTEDPGTLAEKLKGIRPSREEFLKAIGNDDVSRYFMNMTTDRLADLLTPASEEQD